MSFSPIKTREGADGYLAFFTGRSEIAGDNDLFYNRATGEFAVSGAGNITATSGLNVGFDGAHTDDAVLVGATTFGLRYFAAGPQVLFDSGDRIDYISAGNTWDFNSGAVISMRVGPSGVVSTQGMAVGMANTTVPPDNTILIGDTTFHLDWSSGATPRLVFDTNDRIVFTRGTNTLDWVIANSTQMSLNTTDFTVFDTVAVQDGYVRISSGSAGVEAANGTKLVVESRSVGLEGAAISILSANSGKAIFFGGPASATGATIVFDPTANPDAMEFRIGGGATEFTITGSGIGMGTTAPTHGLTLDSVESATGIALYNTVDQVTNLERGVIDWTSDVLTIATELGGSGTARDISMEVNGNEALRISSDGYVNVKNDLYVDDILAVGDVNFRLDFSANPDLFFDISSRIQYARGANRFTHIIDGLEQLRLGTAGVEIALGLNVGFADNSPVDNAIGVGDTTFLIDYNSGSPQIIFDTNDSITYDRTANHLGLNINSIEALRITGGGPGQPTIDAYGDLQAHGGSNIIALGGLHSPGAGGTDTFKAGTGSIAAFSGDIAIGDVANTTGSDGGSIAIGDGATATGTVASISIGEAAVASTDAIAIGAAATAAASQSISIGPAATDLGLGSTVTIGWQASGTIAGGFGVALARAATLQAEGDIAIGYLATTRSGSDGGAIAFGRGSAATGTNAAIAIGENASSTHTSSIAFGAAAVTNADNRLNLRPGMDLEVPGAIFNTALATALDGYATTSGNVNKTAGFTGADGYIAFWTGTDAIAGDNDLFYNRATGDLTIGSSGDLTLSGAESHLILPFNNDTTTPTLGFGDGDTGFHERFDDQVSFISNSNEEMRMNTAGVQILNGLNVGIAMGNNPVDDVIQIGDLQFELSFNSGNPFLQFDSNDNITYTRGDNSLSFNVDAIESLKITGNGPGQPTIDAYGDLQVHGGGKLVLPFTNDPTSPTIQFGDGDSGFYQPADNKIMVAMSGVGQFEFFGTKFGGNTATSGGIINVSGGPTSASIVASQADANTGLGHVAFAETVSDQMTLIAGGVEVMRIKNHNSTISIDAYGDFVMHNSTKLVLPQTDDNNSPTIQFGDGDTGFHETADDFLRVVTAGNDRMAFTTTAFQTLVGSGAGIQFVTASSTLPSFTPNTLDTDTGIGHNGGTTGNQMSLIAGGVEGLRITGGPGQPTIDAYGDLQVHGGSELVVGGPESADIRINFGASRTAGKYMIQNTGAATFRFRESDGSNTWGDITAGNIRLNNAESGNAGGIWNVGSNLALNSGTVITFSGNSQVSVTRDVGLVRSAVGVLRVSDGAVADSGGTGDLLAQNISGTSTTFPVVEAERSTADTNLLRGCVGAKHLTSNNMTDGFGAGIVFSVEDVSSGNQNISSIFGQRDGADDTGALAFQTYISGTPTTKMFLTSAGDLGLGMEDPASLIEVEKSSTSGSFRVFPTIEVNNLSTATHSFASVLVEADDKTVVGAFFTDGLGSGVIGAAASAIGTITTHPFVFLIDSVEVARFDTSNRFGIGLTTPNEILTVNGAISLQESVTPTALDGYGKLYVHPADNNIHYIDQEGVDTDLTAGGGGTPGGGNTEVQFNDSGSFGGSANFTWDGSELDVFSTLIVSDGYVNVKNDLFVDDNITISNGHLFMQEGPRVVLDNDENTYLVGGADSAAFVVGGSSRFSVTTSLFRAPITSGGSIRNNSSPTSTLPAFTFHNDIDTGIGKAGIDLMSLIAGGVEAMRIGVDGYVNVKNDLFVDDAVNVHGDLRSPGTGGSTTFKAGLGATATAGNAVVIGSGSSGPAASTIIGHDINGSSFISTVSIGSGSVPAGASSVSVGNSATAGQTSVAVGKSASAAIVSGVAVGNTATAAFANDIAIGLNANTTGSDGGNIAIGEGAIADGITAGIAIGEDANTGGTNSLSLGRGANASGNVGVSIGQASSATGANCTAVGGGADATNTNSTALGQNTTASGTNCLAVGVGATAVATGDIAMGDGANTTGSDGGNIAIGDGAIADDVNACVAVGEAAAATGNRATAIGPAAKGGGSAAIAIGSDSDCSADNSVCVGSASEASGSSSMAIGSSSTASESTAIVLGVSSNATGSGAIALGQNTNATAGDAIAIGRTGVASHDNSITMGQGANSTGINRLTLRPGMELEVPGAIFNDALTTALDAYGAASGGNVTAPTSGDGVPADGYVAFFTGPTGIAGDNDLFYNRATGDLTLSGDSIFNADAVRVGLGTAALPSLAFQAGDDTGIFHPSGGIGFSVDGTERWRINTNGDLVGQSGTQLFPDEGTSTDPAYSFNGNGSSGMYFDTATNSVFLVNAGIDGLAITDGDGQPTIDAYGDLQVQGGGVLKLLKAPHADIFTPTIQFGDGDSGFYERFDDSIHVTLGGTTSFAFTTSNFRAESGDGSALAISGVSLTAPGFSPQQVDLDTGIGGDGANKLSLIAGAIEGLRISGGGPGQPTIDAYGDLQVQGESDLIVVGGKVGINADDPLTHGLTVSGPLDNASALINTVTQNSGGTNQVLVIRATSTQGTLSDGFGADIGFTFADSAAITAENCRISCVRSGGDDGTSELRFLTSSGGSQGEALRIKSDLGVEIETGLNVGLTLDGTVVDNVIKVGDDTFAMTYSATIPEITFDTNDRFIFNRTSSFYQFLIAGTEEVRLGTTGIQIANGLNVGLTVGGDTPTNDAIKVGDANFQMNFNDGTDLFLMFEGAADSLQYNRTNDEFKFDIDSKTALLIGDGYVNVKNDLHVDDFLSARRGVVGITTPVTHRANFEVKDNNSEHSVVMRVTSDDQNPWAFVVGNDSFSTTPQDGVQIFTQDAGDGCISMPGFANALTIQISGGLTTIGGDGYFEENVVISGQLSQGSIHGNIPDATAQSINWNNGNSQTLDLENASGTVAVTMSNGKIGASYVLKVIQDSATARALTWDAEVLWQGGLAPTISTGNNAEDILTFWYDGTNYYGNFAQDYS